MKRANSIDPDAAAMLNRLRDAGHLSSITPLLTPKDEVKERNGVFGYTGHGYLLTADREGITAALPTKLRDGKRPTLSISMSEIKVGDTVISYGGHGIPELRANERTLYYKRGSVEERYVLRRGVFEQDFVISELPPGRGPIVAKSKVQSNLVHLAGRLAMNAG